VLLLLLLLLLLGAARASGGADMGAAALPRLLIMCEHLASCTLPTCRGRGRIFGAICVQLLVEGNIQGLRHIDRLKEWVPWLWHAQPGGAGFGWSLRICWGYLHCHTWNRPAADAECIL